MNLFCKIRFFITLVLVWVCCCCFMCTPDLGDMYSMSAYRPAGVDSSQVVIECGDSTIKGHTAIYILEDDSIWGGLDTLACKMTMDVFCKGERYPFVEYEWTFYRNDAQKHLLRNWDNEGIQLPVKNSVCGVQKRYSVVVKESYPN